MSANIRGIERPSGETYNLEECRRRNRYLERLIDEMVSIAEEVSRRENLTGTIFIANTIGATRDECGIGFEYPDSESVEERLNRTHRAKQVSDWAKNLPPDQREACLQEWRSKGYEGYL